MRRAVTLQDSRLIRQMTPVPSGLPTGHELFGDQTATKRSTFIRKPLMARVRTSCCLGQATSKLQPIGRETAVMSFSMNSVRRPNVTFGFCRYLAIESHCPFCKQKRMKLAGDSLLMGNGSYMPRMSPVDMRFMSKVSLQGAVNARSPSTAAWA